MEHLYKELKQFGKVKQNEPLFKHVTFKIGGPADFFITVDNIEKLSTLLSFLDGEGIARFVLGGGSNVLFSDEGFEGVVIKIQNSEFRILNNTVEASAGARMKEVSQATVDAELAGFTWAIGVPGTIAGALRGNAAYNGEAMEDVISKVEVYRDGEVIELTNKECQFAYKETVFKQNQDIILRVWLTLKKGDRAILAQEALENTQYREKSQPHGAKNSAGCTFKNLVVEDSEIESLYKKIDDERVREVLQKYQKIPVGRLMDICGLKGVKHGGAMISDIHANFILNMGKATAADVKVLIELAKEKVYSRFGIELEEEIHVV
jgi:UDP-N-acetylmuramate dehydrogenase